MNKATKRRRAVTRPAWSRRRRWVLGATFLAILITAGATLFISSRPVYSAAPEAGKIMSAQEGLRFGILIPKYMPKGFDRTALELKVDPAGANGAPLVDMTYRNKGKKAAVFLRQWVPGESNQVILKGSAPIETKWGTGWLLSKYDLTSLWVDIGQLRVEIVTSNVKLVSREQIVQMANTLGLASEDQVYTFQTEPVEIRGVAPPPPLVVETNDQGVQEVNLTITPGGYSPVRFLVKAGVPVKVNFRALGEVGCGNVVAITKDDGNTVSLSATAGQPAESAEFTVNKAGDYPFNCAHFTYRGIMIVRD